MINNMPYLPTVAFTYPSTFAGMSGISIESSKSGLFVKSTKDKEGCFLNIFYCKIK